MARIALLLLSLHVGLVKSQFQPCVTEAQSLDSGCEFGDPVGNPLRCCTHLGIACSVARVCLPFTAAGGGGAGGGVFSQPTACVNVAQSLQGGCALGDPVGNPRRCCPGLFCNLAGVCQAVAGATGGGAGGGGGAGNQPTACVNVAQSLQGGCALGDPVGNPRRCCPGLFCNLAGVCQAAVAGGVPGVFGNPVPCITPPSVSACDPNAAPNSPNRCCDGSACSNALRCVNCITATNTSPCVLGAQDNRRCCPGLTCFNSRCIDFRTCGLNGAACTSTASCCPTMGLTCIGGTCTTATLVGRQG